MTTPILLPGAERELREAMDWYEARRRGLGLEFLTVVDAALRRIEETPEQVAAWSENPRFRRLVLQRFPYVVFFHLRAQGPEIVAIAHCSRTPGYWAARTSE